jgi:deferrochelatase/peroxidase EfeB
VGAALGPGAAAAASSASASEAVDFYGAHQAGIATPTQQYLQFLSLDLAGGSEASDLQSVLQQLSHGASLIAHGRPVGALETGVLAPVDTGEALGLKPSQVTITIGLGPHVFARVGLAHMRPEPLVELPSFPGDELQSGISGGDIAVQVCANHPQVAFHAVHDLIRLASPAAIPRWLQAGFGRIANSRSQTTPRNLIGFKDGTDNIKVEDHAELDRFVWADTPASPAWMRGGSYLVARRISIQLTAWDQSSLDQQQDAVGRYKVSGAPMGEKREHQTPDLRARRNGRYDPAPALERRRPERVRAANRQRDLRMPAGRQHGRIRRRDTVRVAGANRGHSGALIRILSCGQREESECRARVFRSCWRWPAPVW